MRKKVDLPHPDGPTRQTNSPSGMSRSSGPSAATERRPDSKSRSTAVARILTAVGGAGAGEGSRDGAGTGVAEGAIRSVTAGSFEETDELLGEVSVTVLFRYS